MGQHGACDHVANGFPHVAAHADKLCVVRSMVSQFSEHTQANYFLHTGFGQQGRPSMGAWATYGLGPGSEELPGFVTLNGGLIPVGGLDNLGSGFLPAAHQASTSTRFSTRAPGSMLTACAPTPSTNDS